MTIRTEQFSVGSQTVAMFVDEDNEEAWIQSTVTVSVDA